MKVLLIGDPHLSHRKYERSKLLLMEIKKTILEEKPELTVILGDVLDEHDKLHALPVYLYLDFLNNIKNATKVIHILGNHEMQSSKQFLPDIHSMEFLKGSPLCNLVDYPSEISNGIYGVPYVPPGAFSEAIKKIPTKPSQGIIFCHQELSGAIMSGNIKSNVTDDSNFLEKFKIISGHIHGEQKFSNVWYPGAPIQHAFGDEDNKRIFLININEDRKNYSIEKEIYLNNIPKFMNHFADLSTISSIDFNSFNYNRVLFSDCPSSLILFKKSAEYKNLIEKNIKFKFIQNIAVENNFKIEKELWSFQERYYNCLIKEGIYEFYKTSIN